MIWRQMCDIDICNWKKLYLKQDYFDSRSFDNENPFITNKQKKYFPVCQLTNFEENPWHLKHI